MLLEFWPLSAAERKALSEDHRVLGPRSPSALQWGNAASIQSVTAAAISWALGETAAASCIQAP